MNPSRYGCKRERRVKAWIFHQPFWLISCGGKLAQVQAHTRMRATCLVTRNGATYKMNTTNIGHAFAEPATLDDDQYRYWQVCSVYKKFLSNDIETYYR
jgi:hypothetical protein